MTGANVKYSYHNEQNMRWQETLSLPKYWMMSIDVSFTVVLSILSKIFKELHLLLAQWTLWGFIVPWQIAHVAVWFTADLPSQHISVNLSTAASMNLWITSNFLWNIMCICTMVTFALSLTSDSLWTCQLMSVVLLIWFLQQGLFTG